MSSAPTERQLLGVLAVAAHVADHDRATILAITVGMIAFTAELCVDPDETLAAVADQIQDLRRRRAGRRATAV